jgi:hypothetical protein
MTLRSEILEQPTMLCEIAEHCSTERLSSSWSAELHLALVQFVCP